MKMLMLLSSAFVTACFTAGAAPNTHAVSPKADGIVKVVPGLSDPVASNVFESTFIELGVGNLNAVVSVPETSIGAIEVRAASLTTTLRRVQISSSTNTGPLGPDNPGVGVRPIQNVANKAAWFITTGGIPDVSPATIVLD